MPSARHARLVVFLAVIACLAFPLAAASADVSAATSEAEEECPPIEHLCAEVPEYQGPNAIPPVTMQLRPSLAGDSVANDAEYPPGTGDVVVVGFWEHPPGYEPEMEGDRIIENPCAGEPTMKIAYPVDYGSEKCYAWQHWVFEDASDPTLEGDDRFDLHPNSATHFACSEDGDVSFTQWTTMDCELADPAVEMSNCRQKTASRTSCCRDNPEMIWSQILSGCGKQPPQATP